METLGGSLDRLEPKHFWCVLRHHRMRPSVPLKTLTDLRNILNVTHFVLHLSIHAYLC